VQLPEDELTALRAFLEEELSALRLNAEHERTAQERRRQKLEIERAALLDAHLAEAVPLDLLKTKQEGITAKLAAVEGRLAEIAADFQRVEANLKRAVARIGDCMTAYREASDAVRRQFNLAFFERLFIDDDYNVRAELAPPFDAILGDELRRRAAKADEETRAAIEKALHERHTEVAPRSEKPPQGVLVGANSPTTPYEVVGWSQVNMVGPAGLEPATYRL
jgi:hypothetical protein